MKARNIFLLYPFKRNMGQYTLKHMYMIHASTSISSYKKLTAIFLIAKLRRSLPGLGQLAQCSSYRRRYTTLLKLTWNSYTINTNTAWK